MRHIPVIRELLDRQVLHPAPLLPRYLDNELAQQRLSTLRNGVSIFDLIQRRNS